MINSENTKSVLGAAFARYAETVNASNLRKARQRQYITEYRHLMIFYMIVLTIIGFETIVAFMMGNGVVAGLLFVATYISLKQIYTIGEELDG